jgi:hypothetical protein
MIPPLIQMILRWFFSSNNPIWAPDSRVKAFSNIASNSWSYATKSVPERCQGHRLSRLSGVNDTAEARDREFERLWLPLKGISIQKNYIGELYYPIAITITHKIYGLSKDRFWLERCHWHRSSQNRRFLSRISSRIPSHMQKGFNPCIRGLGEVVWWKKPEVENLVTLSLLLFQQ